MSLPCPSHRNASKRRNSAGKVQTLSLQVLLCQYRRSQLASQEGPHAGFLGIALLRRGSSCLGPERLQRARGQG